MEWHQWNFIAELIGIACSFFFVTCAFLGFGPGACVKSNWFAFGTLLAIWLWTTTIWATHTKILDQILAGNVLVTRARPSPEFWLTFVPQVLSCVFFAVVAWLKDRSAFLGMFSKSKDSFKVHVAGSAYFYGQLFTIVALARSSPSIVFVVKAVEPITTALLAGPTLRQPFNPGLFMGLMIACSGIVLTGLGTSHLAMPHGDNWSIGIFFAFLANLGFSARQCLVKSFYVHEGNGALETFGKVGLAGAAWGILPLLSYSIIAAFTESSVIQRSVTMICSSFHETWSEWLCVSVCYFLYQASSLLILECIAVESHALLVGMKHVFSVVTVSLLLGTKLAPVTLIGLFVAGLGVLIFSKQNTKNLEAGDQNTKYEISADPETPLLKPPLRVEGHEVPTVLYAISGSLMLLGCLSTMW